LVKNKDAVQEEQVPHVRRNLGAQRGREQGHYPFVNVLPRLNLFHLEVLAEVRQVYLKDLLKKLKSLGDQLIVEAEERHHGVLEH